MELLQRELTEYKVLMAKRKLLVQIDMIYSATKAQLDAFECIGRIKGQYIESDGVYLFGYIDYEPKLLKVPGHLDWVMEVPQIIVE